MDTARQRGWVWGVTGEVAGNILLTALLGRVAGRKRISKCYKMYGLGFNEHSINASNYIEIPWNWSGWEQCIVLQMVQH